MLVLCIVMACGGEDEAPTAPDWPPAFSFAPNLFDFGETRQDENSGRANLRNWNFAALAASNANFVEDRFRSLPLLAILATEDPELPFVWEGDRWVASTIITSHPYLEFDHPYADTLAYEVSRDADQWDWRILNRHADSTYLYVHGRSNLEVTSGTWEEYNFLGDLKYATEWNQSAVPDQSNLTITLHNGQMSAFARITYEASVTQPWDRKLTTEFFNPNNPTPPDFELYWNSTDKSGKIKRPISFNDEEFHCWDTRLIDQECEN